MSSESADDQPDFEDLSDEELAETMRAMQEDMEEIQRIFQDSDELGELQQAAEQFAAEQDAEAPVSEFVGWMEANTDLSQGDVQGALDAYLDAAGAESLDETPVAGLQEWLAEQLGGGEEDGEGDDGGDDGGDDEGDLSMEDLEAVKSVVGEVSDHLGDIKDMLAEAEEEREEQLDELERRLSEIEDAPQQQSVVPGSDGEFAGDERDDEEYEHEDVFV